MYCPGIGDLIATIVHPTNSEIFQEPMVSSLQRFPQFFHSFKVYGKRLQFHVEKQQYL